MRRSVVTLAIVALMVSGGNWAVASDCTNLEAMSFTSASADVRVSTVGINLGEKVFVTKDGRNEERLNSVFGSLKQEWQTRGLFVHDVDFLDLTVIVPREITLFSPFLEYVEDVANTVNEAKKELKRAACELGAEDVEVFVLPDTAHINEHDCKGGNNNLAAYWPLPEHFIMVFEPGGNDTVNTLKVFVHAATDIEENLRTWLVAQKIDIDDAEDDEKEAGEKEEGDKE
jgi:hypothetical protein